MTIARGPGRSPACPPAGASCGLPHLPSRSASALGRCHPAAGPGGLALPPGLRLLRGLPMSAPAPIPTPTTPRRDNVNYVDLIENYGAEGSDCEAECRGVFQEVTS